MCLGSYASERRGASESEKYGMWFIVTEDVYYVSGAVLSNWHAGLRTFPGSLCTDCPDVTGAEVPARRVGAALVLLAALVLSTSGLASFSCKELGSRYFNAVGPTVSVTATLAAQKRPQTICK